MKKNIHPQVNTAVTVTCACGNTFVTQSTVDAIKVDICNLCHPFYTGKQKFIDTEGRIDKFKKKVQLATSNEAAKAKKKDAKAKTTKEAPKSLKEMLKDASEQA